MGKNLRSIRITALLMCALSGCNGTVSVTTSGQNNTSTPSTNSTQVPQVSQTTQSTASSTTPATIGTTIPATIPVTTPVTVPSITTALTKPVDATFYPVNQSVNVDLDGDGTKEKILYTGTDLHINGVSCIVRNILSQSYRLVTTVIDG
ncbi:MAG: hypothetical protein WAV55_07180 [Clostridiaceae bacterium]